MPSALTSLLFAGLLALGANAQERRAIAPTGQSVEAASMVAVDVAFDTQFGPFAAPTPAPNVRLELGIGRAKGDAPGYFDSDVLATVQSDAAGHVRTQLLVPQAALEEQDLRLWARVVMPGYTRRTVTRFLQAHRNRKPTKITLYKGSTLYGVVHGAEGEPIDGAHVDSYRRTKSGASRTTGVTTRAGGRFVLHRRNADALELVGHRADRGSGHLRVRPDPSGLTGPVDIRLTPGNLVTGRIVDGQGRGLAGLAVQALATDLDDAATRLDRETRGGVTVDRVLCDAGGRFTFPNLAQGRFHLCAAFTNIAQTKSRSDARPIGEVFATIEVAAGEAGATDIGDLRHDTHRIEIRLVNAEGRSIQPPPHMVVQALRVLRNESESLSWPVSTRSALVLPVEPGHDYRLVWQDAERFGTANVFVGHERQHNPVELHLTPASDACTVTLEVETGGTPLTPPWLDVLDLATETPLGLPSISAEADSSTGRWRLTAQLPARRLRLTLSQRPALGCVIPAQLPREPLSAWTTTLELLPGEERLLPVTMVPAGHVDLAFAQAVGSSVSEARDALLADNWISRERIERAREELGGCEAVLLPRRGEGSPLDLGRWQTAELHSLGRINGLSWFVPGWSARGLRGVSPGEWTLRILRGDEICHEVPILVRAGEVTTVTL